jgi:hypothetical protein
MFRLSRGRKIPRLFLKGYEILLRPIISCMKITEDVYETKLINKIVVVAVGVVEK